MHAAVQLPLKQEREIGPLSGIRKYEIGPLSEKLTLNQSPRQRYNHQEEVVRNTVIGGVENAHMINIVV